MAPPLQHGSLRIGIVGAGRRRNGLGPFFARHCETAGMHVAGVAGRDRASAERAAAGLLTHIGRAPAAFDSARALADAVDLLIVASPVDAHVEGLEAALAAGVPCLCEKPLVLPEQTGRGLELVTEFGRRGLPLFENCQWPFALDTLRSLYPELGGRAAERLAMGLSPAAGGRAMIRDSLSHVLSVAAECAELGPEGAVRNVCEIDPRRTAESNVLTFELGVKAPSHGAPAATADAGWLAVELRLERREQQPRPAWLAIDGLRADRRIGENYSQFLLAPDGREEQMPDPLLALVYRVRDLLTPGARDDPRTFAEIRDRITTRLHCFAAVLDGLGREVP
ncbi:MAG: Gfo/Idh/MocA family oxidoreductase [Planctomycetes bacterium]|nr:Gfo/Idh/MocA family oxidoreductase [Planctomycetota bacterium]